MGNHSVILVANRLLSAAAEAGETLTPMQLLKLSYICHGWMLGLHGEPLFRDTVEAWKYGPVIPNLYRVIKQFGSQPVVGPLLGHAVGTLDELETDLVDQVYDKYGQLSGIALSSMTHQQGTPWALTYTPGVPNLVISNDLIDQHYKDLARSYGEKSAAA